MNGAAHPITLADWLVPGWADFSRQRWIRCFLAVLGPVCWCQQGHWLIAILLHFLYAIVAVQPEKK